MNKVKMLCLVALLPLCVVKTLDAQGESPLITRVERAIRAKEPGWLYIRAVCSSCMQIVPSEKRLVTSEWSRKGKSGRRESVYISISEVASPTEAAKWLSRFAKGEVGEGWQVRTYEIGDEGYLTQFQGGSLSKFQDRSRFSIHFRKGDVVVEASGASLGNVERFAKNVVAQMPAS